MNRNAYQQVELIQKVIKFKITIKQNLRTFQNYQKNYL